MGMSFQLFLFASQCKWWGLRVHSSVVAVLAGATMRFGTKRTERIRLQA